MIKKRSILSLIRGDVSALILIAFVFQLLWLVIVLANPSTDDMAFEADLRTSICRVYVQDISPADQTKKSTDDFVCDNCVLCEMQAVPLNDSLPEYVQFVPQTGPTQTNGAFKVALPERLFLEGEPSPRSPPFV